MEFYRRPWKKLASRESADFHIDDSLNGLASRNLNPEKHEYVADKFTIFTNTLVLIVL